MEKKPWTVSPAPVCSGAEFRALRERLGYPRRALGMIIGRTLGAIARWEMGRTPVPLFAWRILNELRPYDDFQ